MGVTDFETRGFVLSVEDGLYVGGRLTVKSFM